MSPVPGIELRLLDQPACGLVTAWLCGPYHCDLNFVVSVGVLSRAVIGNSKENKLSE